MPQTIELPGQQLVTLDALIGTGSWMSRVYRGHHPSYGSIAVKLVPHTPFRGERKKQQRYLEDEVNFARTLHSPYVRRTYECGNIGPVQELGFDGTTTFFVLEFLPLTLRDLIDERAITGDDVTDIARGVAGALEYIHSRQPPIVHRDLKPENILIAEGRPLVVKLSDFGIARDQGADRITTVGHSAGTARYMPPEQFDDSSSVTCAADLYAFALVLWELLDGTTPYAGSSYPSTMTARRRGGKLPDLESCGNPRPALTRVLAKALNVDPHDRQPSVGVFVEQFLVAGEEDGLWGKSGQSGPLRLDSHAPVLRTGGTPVPSADLAPTESVAGSVLPDPIQTPTGRAWWAAHRRNYNVVLVAAGAAVFALYLVLLNRCDSTRTIGSQLVRHRVEIVTYVAAIAVANVFYSLGPILESAVPPGVRGWYRRLAFTGGALFSAALPFYVPFELFTRGCTR